MEPGSPVWWLHRMAGRLMADQPRMVLMDRYYRGDHPLPFVPRTLKSEFQAMLARSRSNFMRLVCDAPAQRLRVQGFRPEGSEADDPAVWDRWRASGMDSDINLAISDALVMGRSPLSVWRSDSDDQARIRVEDPRGVIVAYDAQDRHRRVAALRMWVDDWTGHIRADVWLPDACYRFTTARTAVLASTQWPQVWQPAAPIDDLEVARWAQTRREEPVAFDSWHHQWTEVDALPNRYGVVPFVELVNRPSIAMWPNGESELDDVYLVQDRINSTIFNRELAAWTTAYRQKWATGLEIPVDAAGEPIEPFQAAIDRLWVSEDDRTKFGEFGATDLNPFNQSIEVDVQHIAVQKQIPRHYFLQQGQDPSGDSMKSAETGLNARVYGMQPILAEPLREVNALADLMDGVSSPGRLDVVWGDPETRTMGETTDAVIKQLAAGIITVRVAQERLGYSPAEISRMATDLAQERLLVEVESLTTATQPAPVAPVEV